MLIALLSGAAGAQSLDARESGRHYEVRYQHWVQNPTDNTLHDVRIYLPIPQSDCGQIVHDWQLMPADDSYDVKFVRDQYGQRVSMIRIPTLAPGAEVEIGFDCTVSLRAAGCVANDHDSANGRPAMPAGIQPLYTHDDEQVFDLQSPIIQQTAERLLTEHPDPTDRAEAIAAYVADTLAYVRDDRWDPAPTVLKRQTGSCSEFSFVFCALCRATGLPTRFVGGSMYSDGRIMPFKDTVWHRWAQVYLLDRGWVDVDSTLGPVGEQHSHLGRRHPRVLALTYSGSKSDVLGLGYIGANSHQHETPIFRVRFRPGADIQNRWHSFLVRLGNRAEVRSYFSPRPRVSGSSSSKSGRMRQQVSGRICRGSPGSGS